MIGNTACDSATLNFSFLQHYQSCKLTLSGVFCHLDFGLVFVELSLSCNIIEYPYEHHVKLELRLSTCQSLKGRSITVAL